MEHYPFATGDLLCRPHARLAQSEPKVKGKMNGKPPLTFSSAGAILQIWQQRNAPLPSSHILFCFTSCFGVYTKLGTHPMLRRFIPKGKPISSYTAEDICYFADCINGLPRKILGYRTPEELFEQELDKIYAA